MAQQGWNQQQYPQQQWNQQPQTWNQQQPQQNEAPPPPPPPSGNPWKVQATQSQADKNAAYLAKMRAKQAAQKVANNPKTDFDQEPTQKITLFGANDDTINKAKIANFKSKKKNKYVTLPNTGLTESQLFDKYKIQSEKIGAGAFARIKIIRSMSQNPSVPVSYFHGKQIPQQNIIT